MLKKRFLSKHDSLRHGLILVFYVSLLFFLLYLPRFLAEFSAFSRQRDELYFSGFSDVIPEEILRDFERQTGIKVHTKYCDSDFEMLVQLSTASESGYDLVSPTGYMAEVMDKEGLLEYIDLSKIKNFQDVGPYFAKNLVEGTHTKIVPISWSAYGLGFKKSFFDNRGIRRPDSLAYVLNPEKIFTQVALRKRFKKYKVCIPDDAQELIFISCIYLFGDVSDFCKARLDGVYNLLVRQRKWTLAYTTADVTYYLLYCVPVLLALGAHTKKALAANSAYEFVLPKEGALINVLNLCIPKGARNREGALKFIDFILSPENQAKVFDKTGFSPTNFKAKSLVEPRFAKHPAYFPSPEAMARFFSVNNILSTTDSQELLTRVRVN